MYPLKAPSLTQTFDREIHRAVKRAQPQKYMAFRISDIAARIARVLSLLFVALYMVVHVTAFVLQLSLAHEVAIASTVLINSLLACMTVYVISGMVCNSLYQELETVVRSTLHDVAMSFKQADQ